MTKQEFQKLTEDHVLLLDGATGSNLMKAGMPRGVCTESWVLEHKDVIQSLQKAYIEAGSHIIYAPTFGGNRINLTMHGLEDQIEQINHTLAGYSFKITFANKSGNIALTIASKTLTNPYPNRFHFACFIYFQVFLTFNLKLLLLSLCIFHLSFFILTLKVFEVLHLQFVLNNLIDFQELQNIKLLLLIYLIHNRYF